MANSTGHGGPRPNSGGKREGAGRPPGITGPGTGRPPGAADKTLAPSRVVPTAQKWAFAERALHHADTMLNVLVNLALNAQSEAVRMASADKVIDRAMGKAPQHFDVTAMRHTDIIYQSAEELRQEFRRALEAEGVPKALQVARKVMECDRNILRKLAKE